MESSGQDIPCLQELFAATITGLADDFTKEKVTNVTSWIDLPRVVLYLPQRMRHSSANEAFFTGGLPFMKNDTVGKMRLTSTLFFALTNEGGSCP